MNTVYDVLIIGAHSRQVGLQSLFGGNTSRIVEATDGDVVLVKASTPGIVQDADNASVREQQSNQLEQFV